MLYPHKLNFPLLLQDMR
uniref:Uncharacterized protein n=1 Tax=Arundo donax TaxID=35708 RepID=A0A0A8ZQ26_ARUDO